MNQRQLVAHNRNLILKALRSRTGVQASKIVKSTGLCLRTVQSHLRALRAENLAHNTGGQWFDGPSTSEQQ